MKTRYITASVLSLSLAFTTTAYAASTDFIDNGAYTTDTISGLDWLDVTTSVNQSYNYVSSQFGTGGVYEAWRYATRTEFNQLISNFTDTVVTSMGYYGRNIHPEGQIDELVQLLGSTLDSQFVHSYGVSYDVYNGVAEGAGADYTYGLTAPVNLATRPALAMISDFDQFPLAEDFTSDQHGYQSRNDHAINVGSYLVRDTVSAVPVPAAVFMFAPALMGFLGLRRRSKQA